MLNSLTHFKKLTKLELYTLNDIYLTAFQVQNNCPNLKHLKFIINNEPKYAIYMPYISDDINIINLNFISNLTYLDLYIPFLSTTYTRYLVDYFPNQLADLRIKLFCQKFFKWIDMVGMELALELMEKVGGVKETYIGFVIYEVYQNQHNRKENMTKYFTLLNSFRGTRQTHCTANFNRGIGEVRNLGYSFRYSSLGRLVVTYNLYPDDLYESDHAYIITLPDKTNSIIGPEIFHNLEFNLWSENENDEVHLALSYSFLNCPGLQSLSIVYHKYGSFRSSLGFICKDEKFSSEQAKRDINFLQIENITAKCLDLVTTHLYNIQIVSLTAKDWSCKGNNPVIDLTVFKRLKSFKYTYRCDHYTTENKFALIKYTNGTERRVYEYDSKTRRADCLSYTILCDISVSLNFCKEKKIK